MAPRSLPALADAPVHRVPGVGEKRATALSALGVDSVLDLVTFYPRRWIDRTNEARIADLVVGASALVLVTVRSIRTVRARSGRPFVSATVADATGRLSVTFFNQAWRERQLPVGTTVALFGKVEQYRGGLSMANPVVDVVGDRTGRIVAIYPQSEKVKITSDAIADSVEHALARWDELGIPDPLPADIRRRYGLIGRRDAFFSIHTPESMAAKEQARRRLAYDELVRVQLVLVLRKRALERESLGIRHAVGGELVARFHAHLPFPLTGAQARTITEIEADLAGPHPMHRLLQGDVGSGKTIVAVSALLAGVQGGHQGALMAPTEVLAEQHWGSVRALLDGLVVPDPGGNLFGERPVAVRLLTNRITGAERREVLAGLASGAVDLVIGTHALIQEAVAFASLGVVVIDEQHRFGVEQRAALRAKAGGGAVPDVLVMTATPIPRTAAMTVYGDLDVSVLDESPPGRTPITTSWANGPLEEAAVWAAVRAEVAAGHQGYVVTPLIEDSEKLEVASADDTYARLTGEGGELAGLRLGLLHGRLPSAEKEAVMDRFRRGELDVLVATTVIEVGVDVPNATVMVIIDADRFGIAQLHQLRGRVGRGTAASTCYLITSGDDGPSARVEAVVASTDGFELAEVDLDLRGEGTIMNTAQKGRSDLKLASLRRDRELVALAREAAFALVDDDPRLEHHPGLLEEVRAFLSEDDEAFLFKS